MFKKTNKQKRAGQIWPTAGCSLSMLNGIIKNLFLGLFLILLLAAKRTVVDTIVFFFSLFYYKFEF